MPGGTAMSKSRAKACIMSSASDDSDRQSSSTTLPMWLSSAWMRSSPSCSRISCCSARSSAFCAGESFWLKVRTNLLTLGFTNSGGRTGSMSTPAAEKRSGM